MIEFSYPTGLTERGRDSSDDRPGRPTAPLVRVADPWRQRVNPGARQKPAAIRGLGPADSLAGRSPQVRLTPTS